MFCKFFNKIIICLIVLCIALNPIYSQTEKNSSIYGRITTQTGKKLGNAHVQIHELRLRQFADNNGFYRIDSLESGTYKVHFSFIGYSIIDTIVQIKPKESKEFNISLIEQFIKTDNIVVTGTRTEKDIENHPIPTEVVSQNEISKTGAVKLDEIISEQTGMIIVEDHGAGVQIQGLDPSYALILLNGEPVIGTTAGKINLNRYMVGNVQRIEIVKGPSSSLYGSNALAGVINLITENPKEPLNYGFSARYGTHNTIDLSGDLKMRNAEDNLGISLFLNGYSTDGYSLDDGKVGNTIPASQKLSGNAEVFYDINSNATLTTRFRFSRDQVTNTFEANINNNPTMADEDSKDLELNLSAALKYKISGLSNLNFRLYGTSYDAKSVFIYGEGADGTESLFYNQWLGKFEAQYDRMLLNEHYFMIGTGMNLESASSGIIAEEVQSSYSYFGYVQDDWQPNESLNIIGSLRFDGHSAYSSYLSPKIAVSYKIWDSFSVHGNVGSGFKAPNTDQLYLNWTNPAAGYSVFGVHYAVEGMQNLLNTGQISPDNIFIKPEDINELVPESSWSYSAGMSWDIKKKTYIKLNVFRNDISELIEFLLLGRKNSGQNVFSYANFESVFTQGIELSANTSIVEDLYIEVGYQYLETGDNEVIEQIEAGEIWTRDPSGKDRPVEMSDYGGLFNRSKHQVQIKVNYEFTDLGLSTALRGTIRSRYGYADMNGNSILDADKEYAPGYNLWNFTLTKDLFEMFKLQVGINNLFDVQGNQYLLTTSGRTFFIDLSFYH
jgi:outer membrane receptor for ferrienterochelin and colicins